MVGGQLIHYTNQICVDTRAGINPPPPKNWAAAIFFYNTFSQMVERVNDDFTYSNLRCYCKALQSSLQRQRTDRLVAVLPTHILMAHDCRKFILR